MSANTPLVKSRHGETEFEHHAHSVLFYSGDEYLIDVLTLFIGSALGACDSAVVIAIAEHRAALARRLTALGVNLQTVVEQGRYVPLDANETLSHFMVNGWPDDSRFFELLGEVIFRANTVAGREHGTVVLFGEMVALLCEQGSTDAALRLEQLWNQMAQSHSFSLTCAYPLRHFYGAQHGKAFQNVCGEHSAVLPAEDYALASEEERLHMIAEWQQKALALEAELAKRSTAQEAASKLAAIVESSEDAIASKDLNGIITSWNASAERMFGYKADDIVGKSVRLIIPPELQKDEDMILSRLRRGERIEHFETVRLTKDGRRIDVSLTVSPVKDENGKIIGAAKIVRDISERKLAEGALQRAEKMAANGQLAATIAHEINNPMQAVTNIFSLLANSTCLDEPTRRLVSLAETELSRVAHITRQMLSFYRQSGKPVPVKPTEVLDDVLELFATKIRSKDINVERRYEFTGTVRGFPVELRQLFANLLGNAIEAVDQNGHIHVHIRPAGDAARPEWQGVRIVVADDGPGIMPEVRSRIFQPFFTTKAEKGTGLGLWVAKGMVDKHGGSIRVRSSVRPDNSGTIFSVFLPRYTNVIAINAGRETDSTAA